MSNCTSLGLKFAAANIGLPDLRCSWGVVCKARGVTKKVFVKSHKCDVGLCVKQHVSKTTTQRHNCKNTWCDLPKKIWASRRYVSKENWKFSIFHIIIMYNYKLKILTGFLNTCTNISVLFPQKMTFNTLFNLIWFP